MDYTIFKMHFKTALHIGEKNLTDSEMSIMADTLFSALCHEALAFGGNQLERLVVLAKEGQLVISDALPYIDNDLYIPKPIYHITANQTEDQNDYSSKKAFKKLKYIPVHQCNAYFSGELDARFELDIFRKIGASAIRTQVAINDKPEPYHVGAFSFADHAGLYVLVGCAHEMDFIKELFMALSYSGIGGKRSSGLGKFTLEQFWDDDLGALIHHQDAQVKMTINVSMAKDEELENCLAGASYALKKRSGFVSSPTYADTLLKKRDFYAFSAGSCFQTTFAGDVFDVSQNGNHPVYRYAKPIFLGVNV